MIKIKPHHFIDIIKLYGKGITVFIPNKEYNHNFYLVANEIINNQNTLLQLTIGSDDICLPCKYNSDNICIDTISHIEGINSKEQWNRILDNRILKYANRTENQQISASDFCNLIYSMKEFIFDVWKEDSDISQKDRYNLFYIGAKQYLHLK